MKVGVKGGAGGDKASPVISRVVPRTVNCHYEDDKINLVGHGLGKRIILSHAFMTAFTFVATYLISYFGFEVAADTPLKVPRRQVNITDFHISTSVDYGIARCIGSVGLPMVGVGFCLIATWRYFYVHAHLPSREGAFTLFPHKRNNISLICAFVASVGIFGVAAFPSVVHKPAHFFFAFVAFSNIVAYMMMQISRK